MIGTIDVKIRPIRLAFLVEPGNETHVREAVSLASTLWGGSYFPIIPLYRRMPATWKDSPLKAPLAKNVILGYIEAFDPDILVQFTESLPDYINDQAIRVIKPSEIWEPLSADRHSAPQFGVGIFELLNDVFAEHFKYKSKYPVRVVLPQIPAELSLFWHSLLGAIPPTLQPVLEAHYQEPLELQTVEARPASLKELLGSDVLFPRRISQHGLEHVSRSGFHSDAFVYFMDGTKPEDVIDFWNLRAMGKRVVPVPKQLQHDSHLRSIVTDFLKATRRPWRHNPTVCDVASIVRGRSCTMTEVEEFAKTLRFEREPTDPSSDRFYLLQHWYPRVWDEWARDKDGAVPADIYGDGEHSLDLGEPKDLQFRFKPITPKFADRLALYGEPRWANELSFRFFGTNEYLAEVLPRAAGPKLGRTIAGLTSFQDWRVGRNGLVKLVEHDFTETREIPSASKIMSAWLADMGWNLKLSPPGLLAQEIYRRFDGFTAPLQNEELLSLLEHMSGGSARRDGASAGSGKIAQERELPVGEVKRRVAAGAARHQDLHALALEKGIFKLGPRIQCPTCLRNSWYSLTDVADFFTCPKCQTQFPALGHLDGAVWCYKTTGPFSVPGYADGAYSVLLALALFDSRRMHTMRRTPIVSFIAEGPGNKSLEADFALLWEQSLYGHRQSGIAFGESKTYGLFGATDFARMRHIAQTFPGSVLVFSTLRRGLTTREIAEIRKIARAGRKYWKAERPINPVLILTGTELLAWSGPPYCWDKPTQERFHRVTGLLELCDATQQLYLDLPSWTTEWHEQWEVKRRRRALARVARRPNPGVTPAEGLGRDASAPPSSLGPQADPLR